MRSLLHGRVTRRLRDLQASLRHAFTTASISASLSGDDVKCLERVAEVIVKRGMAAPATVFLESMGPMNFLGSQALHFVIPIIDCAFDAKEVEQVARLLERRETLPRLIAIIDAKSSVMRAPAQ